MLQVLSVFWSYQMDANRLSAQMLVVVRRRLADDAVDQADCSLSKRERAELMETLGRS